MNLTHHRPYWEVQIWGKKLRSELEMWQPVPGAFSEKKAHLLYGTLWQRCSVFLPWWSESVWGQETAAILQSCAWLVTTPWTVAHQAPLSIGFSRQEYWSGLPFPSSGDLPRPGIELSSLASPALAGGFFTTDATWEACAWAGDYIRELELRHRNVLWTISGSIKSQIISWLLQEPGNCHFFNENILGRVFYHLQVKES